MLDTTAKLLTLTGEAAVLARAGRLSYATPAALALLGDDCVGKRIGDLFGEAVTGSQSSSFLAQIQLRGRPVLIQIARLGEEQIYFLRPQEELPAVLNQPFLYSLRSTLMNMELAADQIRSAAEDRNDTELLERLRAITRGQFQILRILNNAALILGVSEGSTVCAPRVFSLSALCASVLEAAEGMVPGIRFQGRFSGDVPVRADPSMIKNLLLNLLSNAIRHGQGCSRISLSLLESGRSVVLAVDDDGCGIPPEALPQVFDRYRHSHDLSQMGAGPGLGLTAARLVAQLHGGTLLLESRPQSGTTLRVSLRREEKDLPRLHAPGGPVLCEARDLLTGLADCLPQDCFSERYLD